MEVWADELALFIWHEEGAADLTEIKKAKAGMNLDAKVVPMAVSKTSPPPAGARILAIGSRPPWVHDYALVTERTSQAGLQRALAWCFGNHEDEKATTVVDILTAAFPANGHGRLKELTREDLEAEEKMRRYIGGED